MNIGKKIIKILIKTMGGTKAVCAEILIKTWVEA